MVLLAIGFSPIISRAASPEITDPFPQSTLTSDHQTFYWASNGANVAQWQLNVGTSQGAYDIYDTGALDPGILGYTVFGLPTDGSTIYVRLYYKVNLFWLYRDFTYTAVKFQGDPQFTYPQPGSTLKKDLQEFTWTDNGNNVEKYQLYAGSSPGANDIFDYPMGTSTSVVLNQLPTDGRVVYVTLAFWINGVRGETQAIYLAKNSPGFRSDFWNNMDGWYNPSGAGDWSVTSENLQGFLHRTTDITILSSCYRCMPDGDTNFNDFVYEARLCALGRTRDYVGLIFRGDPWPFMPGSYNLWYEGYVFVVSQDGYYQILKILDGTYHTLKDWTFHPKINQGFDYNTLKVSALGPTMDFCINGDYVTTVVDHDFTSGNVGVIGLKYEAYYYDILVDYAELTSY